MNMLPPIFLEDPSNSGYIFTNHTFKDTTFNLTLGQIRGLWPHPPFKNTAECTNEVLFCLAIMENSKWDQPSGEKSDRPVSTPFRVYHVWWPDKLLQACLGENRFLKGQFSPHPTLKQDPHCDVRPRRSVWEVCKNIEIQLKGFCCVPPLNNDSLLDDPAMMRDFVSQRNWDAYLEHSGTLCSQMSKDKTQQDTMHQKFPAFFPSGCPLPEELDPWRSSLKSFQQATKLLEQPASCWYGYHWAYSFLKQFSTISNLGA